MSDKYADAEPVFINHTLRVSDLFRGDPEPIKHRWDAGLPMNALVMFYGPSGLGKTAFLLHLLVCIAAGIDCLGKPVDRCIVYYFVGEGAAGIPQRVRAIMESLGLGWNDLDDWFFIRVVPTDVTDIATRTQFARELNAHMVHQSPGILVFDTTSAHAPAGYDENSTRDATTTLAAYREVGREYNATVILVTHTGHANGPAGERMRGSSAFFAAADVTLKLSKLGEVTRSLTWEKARDFAPPEPLKFTMTPKFGGVVIGSIHGVDEPDSHLTPTDRAVLLALVLHGDGSARRTKEWERKAESLGVAHTPFYRSQKKLTGTSYVISSRTGYLLTLKGQGIIDAVQQANGDGDLVPQYQTGTKPKSGSAEIGTTTPVSLETGSGTDTGIISSTVVPQYQFGATSVPGTESGAQQPNTVDDDWWQSVMQENAA